MLGVLDIVLILIFVGSIVISAIQGFAKSAAGFVRFGVSLFLAKTFSPLLGGALNEYLIGPRLHLWLEAKVYRAMEEIGSSVTFDQLFAEGNEFSSTLTQLCDAEQLEALRPQFHDGVAVTQESIGEMVGTFADAWAERFFVILAAVLIFIVSFVVLLLLTALIIAVVKHVHLLKRIDRTLGALLGVALGACNIVGFCVLCNLIAGMIVLFGGSADALLDPVNSAVLAGPIYRFAIGFFAG